MADAAFQDPPLGFPMPQLQLAIVLEDGDGTLYRDARGYLWRGPEYRPRFDLLKQADPSKSGGWMALGNWFRSRKQSPEYTPPALEQVIDYTRPAVGAATDIGLKIAIGVMLYAGFQVLKARGWKIS